MSCDPCNQSPICSDDVKYSGPNLVCTTIGTCDSMSTAFQKLNSTICTLQSTLVILQNQLNSYTTTTTTSSTSTTSTTSTSSSTTTTTTVAIPSISIITNYPSGPQSLSLYFRKNGGSWNLFIWLNGGITPTNTLNYGGVYPLQYTNGIPMGSGIGNINASVGDFVEFYVVTASGLQNINFGAGFTGAPPSGDFASYCGSSNPYGFVYTNTNRYININVTPATFPFTGSVITC